MTVKVKGFTLVELLIVIAIIFVLAGALTPRLATNSNKRNLDNDTKLLVSNLHLARQYAIAQRKGYRYYGLSFYSGYYQLSPFSATGSALAAVVVPGSKHSTGKILFNSGTKLTSGPKTAIFDFRGATAAATIKVNNKGLSKTINITDLGQTTIQ